VVVTADARLLGGARASYVAHRAGGKWFVGAPGFLDQEALRTEEVPLERLVAADSSLGEVADLKPGWHAFREGSAPWWSEEIPVGQTFVLAYEVRPTELVPDRDGIGGGYASCWLVSLSLARARETARKHLEQTGWAIVAPMREQAVRANEVSADAAAYYRRAQVEGEVYVIEAFPPEPPDA
jgi:hypothetical protein